MSERFVRTQPKEERDEAPKQYTQTDRLGPTITAIAGLFSRRIVLGGTLSFLGPSTLLSTIFRASSKRLRWRRQRRRAGEPQAVLVVDRDDEPGLTLVSNQVA